jgi:hypothetical protein
MQRPSIHRDATTRGGWGSPREVRRLAIAILVFVAALAGLVAGLNAPAIGDASQEAVIHSIEQELSGSIAPCAPAPGPPVTCEVSPDSDPAIYRIVVDGDCWSARLLDGYARPRHAHACAMWSDQLRLW